MYQKIMIIFVGALLSTSLFAASNYFRPSDEELKEKLTPLQYYVTQTQGIEPAYKNSYWNNYEPGIYIDVITREPLFVSTDKYDAKSGWPSFSKPINEHAIIFKEEPGNNAEPQVQVYSKIGKTFLGYLYDDGPAPNFERYNINSAALIFIPKSEMQERGYTQYIYLVKNKKT